MIEAVVWDIGNVLLEWNPERFYDGLMPRAERERMFREAGLHAMNEGIDAGAVFRETVHAHAEGFPEWRELIVLWHDRWDEILAPAIDRSVRLLRALRRAGVPVFALSNFGRESFALAETAYPFLAEFDRRYISGRMGVIKPDPEIFARVEADCGVAPAGLLFVDDRPENLAVAAARGWGTHRFEGPEGWAARLVADGLLSVEDAA